MVSKAVETRYLIFLKKWWMNPIHQFFGAGEGAASWTTSPCYHKRTQKQDAKRTGGWIEGCYVMA